MPNRKCQDGQKSIIQLKLYEEQWILSYQGFAKELNDNSESINC